MSQDSEISGSYLPPEPPPPPPPPMMNSLSPYPPEPPAGRHLEWHEVWIQMLTQPSVESYRAVLRDPAATPSRVYVWVFVTSTLAFIASLVAQYISPFTNDTVSPVFSLFCLPFVGALAILGLIIGAGIYYIVSSVLGGKGTFSNMVYLVGALGAPIQLINILATFIPYPLGACITLPVGIYSLVLTVIIIEAVHGFGWPKAIGTALWWVPLACLCGCLLAMLLTTMDSNTFQNIIDSLITPTP